MQCTVNLKQDDPLSAVKHKKVYSICRCYIVENSSIFLCYIFNIIPPKKKYP